MLPFEATYAEDNWLIKREKKMGTFGFELDCGKMENLVTNQFFVSSGIYFLRIPLLLKGLE